MEYPHIFDIHYRPEAGVFTAEDKAFQKAFTSAIVQFIKSRFFILIFNKKLLLCSKALFQNNSTAVKIYLKNFSHVIAIPQLQLWIGKHSTTAATKNLFHILNWILIQDNQKTMRFRGNSNFGNRSDSNSTLTQFVVSTRYLGIVTAQRLICRMLF